MTGAMSDGCHSCKGELLEGAANDHRTDLSN